MKISRVFYNEGKVHPFKTWDKNCQQYEEVFDLEKFMNRNFLCRRDDIYFVSSIINKDIPGLYGKKYCVHCSKFGLLMRIEDLDEIYLIH